MTTLQETAKTMANATFQVKFSKLDRGPDVYFAHIYITGQLFGSVCQRRGGRYEAFTKNQHKVGEADSLSQLRELVVEFYAANAAASAS